MEDEYYSYSGQLEGVDGQEQEQEQEQEDYSSAQKVFVVLWVLIIVFINIVHQRRSTQLYNEQTARNEMLQLRLVEDEARLRRFDPERRKKEIDEQIVTREIQNFDEAKSILIENRSKGSSLPTTRNTNSSSNNNNNNSAGDIELGKRSNVEIDYPSLPPIQGTEDYNEDRLQYSNDSSARLGEDNNDLEVICSICLEAFEAGDKLSWSRDVKCQHIFHNECLIPWVMNHDECPYCRTVVIDDFPVNMKTNLGGRIND